LVELCANLISELAKESSFFRSFISLCFFFICEIFIILLGFLNHIIHTSEMFIVVCVAVFLFFVVLVAPHLPVPRLGVDLSFPHLPIFGQFGALLNGVGGEDLVVSILLELLPVVTHLLLVGDHSYALASI
jgi:hypothetical protein